MRQQHPAIERSQAFAQRLGLQVPVFLAPMAGACPPELSRAVSEAGGLGACGALLMSPEQITHWTQEVRAGTDAKFQLNTWIPDPEPERDAVQEARLRDFLSTWEQEMGADEPAPSAPAIHFEDQCEAMLAANPLVISSIMGVFSKQMVDRIKRQKICWFATVTTVKEAVLAVEAGADVIVAQGMEAGGHRGTFNAASAESSMVGLFALLPAIVRAVDVPVVASGGIADSTSAAAALLLGASAVQMGTGFLRTHESNIAPAWSDAIARTAPEDTAVTRAFSGRLGRSVNNRFVEAAQRQDAPLPAAYPVQRGLTQTMRTAATRANNIDAMQAWAGQSAGLAKALPAGIIVQDLWSGMQAHLS